MLLSALRSSEATWRTVDCRVETSVSGEGGSWGPGLEDVGILSLVSSSVNSVPGSYVVTQGQRQDP